MKTLSRRFALRALVAGALLFLALGPTAEAGAEGGAGTTVVYYFHATARCATCRTIEAYAHEALTSAFGAELKAGEVEWRMVNVEEPGNEHFMNDFGLYTRSVVLTDAKDAKRFKVLDRVWQLVQDKAAFQRYVEDEVRAFRSAG